MEKEKPGTYINICMVQDNLDILVQKVLDDYLKVKIENH